MKGLRETRKELGISQCMLAEMTGILQVNLSALEHQRRTPNESTREKIETALGTKIDWIALEKINFKSPNYFKAEKLISKLIEVSILMSDEEKQDLTNLLNKYFN